MVDHLKPTDFPMGLFMVQALMIGRSQRQFEGARAKFLDEVRARIGAANGSAAPRPPTRKKRRTTLFVGLAAALLLVAVPLYLFWPQLMFWLNPDASPVSPEKLKASIEAETLARQRVARGADTMLSGEPVVNGSTWAWGASQLIAAAPAESRDLTRRYFDYLRSVVNADCGCYTSDSVPHAVANAWVILAAARLRQPIPPRLLETVLAAQHPEGWWTISFNAVRTNENAAMHPTAMLAIALAEAKAAGIVPAPSRARVELALRRAVVWLNRGPQEGASWADYPNNDRRTENLVFAAYATVAAHVAGEGQPSNAASAFIRSARALPPATEQFASGAYIPLTTGGRFFDDYRHPTSPWIGAAAVIAYRQANGAERRALREIIRSWLDVNLGDQNLLRLDWITGETLFLRALAFRELQARPVR
jgi:hypothetical protein